MLGMIPHTLIITLVLVKFDRQIWNYYAFLIGRGPKFLLYSYDVLGSR
jgi:hypothetical protein